MSKKGKGHRSVEPRNFDAAMRQVLRAKPHQGQRSENRRPIKTELEARYRLNRRKGN